ncbi:unnamed protein product [Choristocarpus tenellus]
MVGYRTVKVILLEDVKGRGYRGEEVSVKSGFMRNFLYPTRQAVYATSDNIAKFKAEENMEDMAKIQALKALARNRRILSSIPITFKRHVEQGLPPKGNVTAQNVSDYLQKKGMSIPADNITLPNGEPIKTLGEHHAKVLLELPEDAAAVLEGTDLGTALSKDAEVDIKVNVIQR